LEKALTTTLIVLAHPDPRSFNGAWAITTRRASEAQGDKVLFSDLVAMGFDPVERASHYPYLQTDMNFDPLKAQEEAADQHRLPEDVKLEIEKLRRADRVVFHFPIWWFGPPEILKGWFDRVLAHGDVHSVTNRFDKGHFIGKKALFCVTTGSKESESAFNGKEGDIQMLLWPAAYTLRLGFSVAEPEIVHGVHGYHKGVDRDALHDRLAHTLDAQKRLISKFEKRALLEFNSDVDFDENGTLRADQPSYSHFIRNNP
jgi:NAD(P)H dehydrogenase (quinone)